MTSGQETERVHSYNPGARTGHKPSGIEQRGSVLQRFLPFVHLILKCNYTTLQSAQVLVSSLQQYDVRNVHNSTTRYNAVVKHLASYVRAMFEMTLCRNTGIKSFASGRLLQIGVFFSQVPVGLYDRLEEGLEILNERP